MEPINKLKKISSMKKAQRAEIVERLIDVSIYQHIRSHLNIDIGPDREFYFGDGMDYILGDSGISNFIQERLELSDLTNVVVDDSRIPFMIFCYCDEEVNDWFFGEEEHEEDCERSVLYDKFWSGFEYDHGTNRDIKWTLERISKYGIKIRNVPREYNIRLNENLPTDMEGIIAMHNAVTKENAQREAAAYHMLPKSERDKIKRERRDSRIAIAAISTVVLGIAALVIYWSENSKGGPVNSAEEDFCSIRTSNGRSCTESDLESFRNIQRLSR